MQDGGTKAFHRGRDRIIGGVSSGLALGFHVDVLLVRLAFVILAFFQGIGLFIYIVLWLVMPEDTESGPRSGFESVARDMRRIGDEVRGQIGAQGDPNAGAAGLGGQALVLGAVLVILGAVLLVVNTGLVSWTVMWPVAVIAIGAGLLLRGLRRRG